MSRKAEHELWASQVNDVVAEAARSAAPVFALNGWTWRRDDPPDAAQIAAMVAMLAHDCETAHEASSGRLHVHRYVDELGCETLEVTLTLASVAAVPEPSPRGAVPSGSGE